MNREKSKEQPKQQTSTDGDGDNLLAFFKKITHFVFDVDGVLTDGFLSILDDGQMVRRMNIKDGYALQLAVKQGYRVLIITGGNSETVRNRLNRLGIEDVFLKVENKKQKLAEYMAEKNIFPQELLFMGDDIPDYTAMQISGLACAPADAAPEIKQISQYISPVAGGYGCARDVIEKVLKLNGHWPLDTTIRSK
jgi:3-deoxy-D-manno-octulosonate 8-phosphate phosphatase (KDO 8-P phosphatase)